MKLKRRGESKPEREEITPPQPEIIEAEKYKRTYFGPDEPTLELDCWEEALSEAQLKAFKNADDEYKSIQNKLDDIVKETGGEIVYNGDQFTAYQLLGKQPVLKDLENKSAEILRSRSRSISKEPKEKKRSKRDRGAKRTYSESPERSPERETRHKSKKHKKDKDKKEKENKEKEKEKEKEKDKDKEKTKDKTLAPSNIHSVVTNVRPSEATAIGGLATGAGAKNTPIVDLTKEDASNKNIADSREVSFNKLQGKTFPSLVVVARPYLRAKDTPAPSDRGALDSKVKSVLMHTPTKFTEWLIQQGLVRSEQLCAVHPGNKLKLGMYSDVSKFPYSGGYVWISECCPTRFVSVFSSSVFEGATHPPSVLLKLVYHWACQTNVQNVVQWVKVDNLYVKGLFTWLRAACTAALHQHMGLLGGHGKKIEVGVISLGTTSHDGQQRQVKVEVLGILDPAEKIIRLRAVEPLSEHEKNYKKRFQKILEPLTTWVNPASTILTDLTVDKGTLLSMGFKTVHQSSSSDPSAKHSNANIMEYLRRIVPRMFQNTLSLLSRQIIQQFLDELVWREKYGITPGQAFDNMVTHLAEQTRYDCKDQIVLRLNKVAQNPFKNWKHTQGKKSKHVEPAPVEEEKGRGKRGRKPKHFSPPPPPSPPPVMPKKKGRPKKVISYIEDDDEEESIPLAQRKLKIKQEKKDKPEKPEKPEKVSKRKREIKTYALDDLDDVPLKSIKKEVKQEVQSVALEKYYFGQAGGSEQKPPAAIAVQCTSCYTEINNNCELLRHIMAHAVPAPDGAAEVASQCRYCLALFTSDEDLQIHLKHQHPKDTKTDQLYTYACLICEVRFAAVITLANHMQKTHAPLELPYCCGRCDYRSSSHRATVDHFYSAHARDTVVQCPHCLLVVSVYTDGCDLQSNVEYFAQHLLQHQDKDHTLKCNRCTLKFVHLGMMKEHQVRCHVSVEGARPLCVEEHLITKPKTKPRPPVKDSTNHGMLQTYEALALAVPEGLLCKECCCQLDDDKHFLGTCKCNKCPFVSSCWRSMLQHTSYCPGSNAHQTGSTMLPHQAHCVCGFTTQDASSMLAHMLMCERKSAYPSEEEAKANLMQPEVAPAATAPEPEPEPELEPEAEPEPEAPRKDPEDLPVTQQPTTNMPPYNVQSMSDYPAPPSVLNTQLSLDDLAPPSVMQSDQHEPELVRNEQYEQPLATPQVRHEEMETPVLHAYMGDFEPLPAEPPHQPEFEPL